MGFFRLIIAGAAIAVAGPIALPLLMAGNCDGIDGGCGGSDE